MLIFWTLTGLACALAGLLILSTAGAAGGAAASGPEEDEAARGRALARDLEELDRMAARGVLAGAELEAARAEVARRHLEEGDRVSAPLIDAAARLRQARWVLAGTGATALAALALYIGGGSPGVADQPYARRVAEWAETPGMLDAPKLAAVMEREAANQPENFEAQALLGAARFEAGDPIGAASALRRAAMLRPDDAQTWARLGEALVQTQEGEVGTDAEMAFLRALELDPGQLGARYFLGELALQRGEGARVHELWSPLIAALAPTDPRRVDLESRLPSLSGSDG
ncbi:MULTISPECIES: c-type cytochrome biogenesis protein CcmI [unclassified Brevundimonas]|jgi:cytochrome c-type biogenesis protein CcmH|uniref:c-type cytochrome biogenesis protein CcmI n=1 Tax=unclassified Brevundimonas TaxID=2622653 RepID=UPI000C629F36|nr:MULTISPECIES: c-type cytochrome biogenesis protein CcmI [unclassified Brevundimonas]MAL88338.1 c-type cytochrome biogenesis protein CcmI [Brevundimonas sp.]